jgi:hypothetical protein
MLMAEGYDSQQYVYFETLSGQLAYSLTGVVRTTFKGTGNTFTRDTLEFRVPIPDLPGGQGLKFDHWAAFVTLNSIANDDISKDAAWAVDSFQITSPETVKTEAVVDCGLAVRDVDGFILRVGYAVSLVGKLEKLPF